VYTPSPSATSPERLLDTLPTFPRTHEYSYAKYTNTPKSHATHGLFPELATPIPEAAQRRQARYKLEACRLRHNSHPAPEIPLPGPAGERHGEHQVVVVSLAPGLVGVVGRGDVDLHPEVQKLLYQGVFELQGIGDLQLAVLQQHERGGDQVPLGNAEASRPGSWSPSRRL
jgi:hypothetical protein